MKQRQYRHWTLYAPYVRNYDLIVGTLGTNKGIIFEVTQKSDSMWRGILMHQEFNTIQIEESDIRYQLVAQTLYPINPVDVEIVSLATTITSDAVIE